MRHNQQKNQPVQTDLELKDDNTSNKNFNIVSRNILNDLEKK